MSKHYQLFIVHNSLYCIYHKLPYLLLLNILDLIIPIVVKYKLLTYLGMVIVSSIIQKTLFHDAQFIEYVIK